MQDLGIERCFVAFCLFFVLDGSRTVCRFLLGVTHVESTKYSILIFEHLAIRC